MQPNKEQTDEKTTELADKKQTKLLTFPFPKPQYFDLRFAAMKREIPVPELASEIFMMGWERYQQQKQSA